MANALNLVLRKVIFQELRVASGDIIQFIPIVCAFYASEFPLFYIHYNHESEATVISFAMGTRQGDLLKKTLFVLVHFKILCSTSNHFPSCLFPSIINDIHVISLLSIVSSTYDHFQIELCEISISIQP